MAVMCLSDLGQIITGNTPSKTIDEFYETTDINFVKTVYFYSVSMLRIY